MIYKEYITLYKMSSLTQHDVNDLLERWANAKQEIVELEAKIEKYKKLANKIMDKSDSKSIQGDYYSLSRKDITRKTISKNDVPEPIWEKYSRPCTYQGFYITKNK
jgi:hypothetical protein